ncbi:hypothetical protein DF281_01560 [Kurthia zopfii]|uniref:hypothetical protein n=1 Tax=Kurthia zopfii TaxID=1650 RepID=UPI000D67A6D1|nr:hypothetical protein [Kurthia zopfii]PWI23854.1 hypothetical protein DF281_01560 [Kurthia zopfii]
MSINHDIRNLLDIQGSNIHFVTNCVNQVLLLMLGGLKQFMNESFINNDCFTLVFRQKSSLFLSTMIERN